LTADFLDYWRGQAASLTPQAVALALLTSAHAEKAHRENQVVELVWTGPETGVVPFRRTEQAILQVIDSAVHRILVVSYAVYNIPRICEALVRAADRGVSINVIIETPDRLEGQNTYDTLKALGPTVAARSAVYLWPLEKREKDDNGKPGILHVKCAVADGRWLFLSSANLTEYAFTLNMELGLLIRGGSLPLQVEGHFDRMIQTGVLRRP
jgi:phosphatidylserine/phosphatidylglycerophosphate/cardiolipin synthase-like enzyme